MELPTLTIAILTYKRPHYALLCLTALRDKLGYDGPKRFLISDGGSPEWHLDMYEYILKDEPHSVLVHGSNSFADMFRSVGENGGEVWITALDDFILEPYTNLTQDVRFLMQHEDIGHLRYANMNGWDVPNQKCYAELRGLDYYHYWTLDKARCTMPYMWTLGWGMTHRRMWDAYGRYLQNTPPHMPGEMELEMNRSFYARPGPTIAVPLRVFEESDLKFAPQQVIRHIGMVRTDEYSGIEGVSRWGAT